MTRQQIENLPAPHAESTVVPQHLALPRHSARKVRGKLLLLALCVPLLGDLSPRADGGVIFGNAGLNGGSRWDAAPRTIGANERSLDGGLRYSLEGGSFQAYRDMFQWSGGVPSVADFQQAVEQSFAAWTSVDPVSGLGTTLSFAADLGTAVVGTVGRRRRDRSARR